MVTDFDPNNGLEKPLNVDLWSWIQNIENTDLHSVYVLDFLHVLIYVDGLIVSGSTLDLITAFKDYLSLCFHMKELGISKYLLRI